MSEIELAVADESLEFSVSQRNKVKRGAKRASYNKSEVYQLIDDLKLGHVGFQIDGQVFVIPITLWRVGE